MRKEGESEDGLKHDSHQLGDGRCLSPSLPPRSYNRAVHALIGGGGTPIESRPETSICKGFQALAINP